MSTYSPIVNYTAKDSLSTGDPLKRIKGTELSAEFTAIGTMSGTKADLASPVLTGTPSAPTAAVTVSTTQLATTAFVHLAVSSVQNASAGTAGLYNGGANILGFATNTTSRGTVSASGNWAIAGPGSGIAMTINGVAGTHSTKHADSAAALFNTGFLEAPQNNQNGNYTFVLADSGKHVFHNNAGAHAFTIPPNSSVAYPIGTIITIVNNLTAGVVTITQGAGVTLRWAGTAGAGANRSLAAVGIATLIQIATDTWFVSGSGLT